METTEYSILELLKDYKWSSEFVCTKCGHTQYNKGKKPFSRKCKACDRDESVMVNTAFEGVKIPATKIYAIAEYIWKHCTMDHDEKTIVIEPRKKVDEHFGQDITDSYNEGKSISVNELLDQYVKKEISQEAADSLLAKNMEAHKINIAETARIFQVEENTLSKLLKKMSTRINHLRTIPEDDPIESIWYFVANEHYSFDEFLGLLMFPMDDKWVNGKMVTGDGRKYELYRPSRLYPSFRWRTIESV